MSKRRGETHNWFTLPYEERKELLGLEADLLDATIPPVQTQGFIQRIGVEGVARMRTVELTHYALSATVTPHDGLLVQIHYDPSRFDAVSVARRLRSLIGLFEGLAAAPESPVEDLPQRSVIRPTPGDCRLRRK